MIENRKKPIRSMATFGNAREEHERDKKIMDAIHIVTSIYTSVDFSKMHEDDMLLTLHELKDFVLRHHSSLSIADIKEAFSLAASKKIKANLSAWNGKFTGEMLGNVLFAYKKLSDSIYYEYLDTIDNMSKKESKEEEKRKKKEKNRKYVISEYLKLVDQYKEFGEFDENKIHYYWGRILDDAGYITFNLEDKRAILQEARIIVERQIMKELRDTTTPFKRKGLQKIVKVLKDKNLANPDEFNGRVKWEYSILIIKKSIYKNIKKCTLY